MYTWSSRFVLLPVVSLSLELVVSLNPVPVVSLNSRLKGVLGPVSRVVKKTKCFFVFITLDIGPRRPLGLKLTDTPGTRCALTSFNTSPPPSPTPR